MWQRRDWACGKNKGSLYFPNKLTLPLLQVDTLAHILAINPDIPWVCVFCLCVERESRELMRQACGGPPALSQINHAADPVPSAWGPNHARMLSLSHGPGPLSSPQHSSSGVGGSGTPQNATLCFLSSLSFSFFLLWTSGDRKTEASISSSLHHSGNNGPFLLLIGGPCQWGLGFAVVEKGGGRVLFARGLPHLPWNNSPMSLCIGKQPMLLLLPLLQDWAPAPICLCLLNG